MTEISVPPKYGSKLQGKRVLVMGGTSGIGFCIAEAAQEFGATVIISGSNQAKLDNALQGLAKIYSTSTESVRGFAQDLSNVNRLEENLERLLRHATENGCKKLDHIVYTAGNVVGLVDLNSLNLDHITTNGILRFYVPIMIGKLAPKYLTHSRNSSITFTSGYSHLKPRPGRVLMAGWAAGVEGVTRALAVDMRPIRVNCVCPGAVHTELFNRLPKEQLDPLVDAYVSKTLTGNIGRADEVVEAYLFCMKDSFIDGTIVHSNGGYFLG